MDECAILGKNAHTAEHMSRLWQIIPKKVTYYSIILFSGIEPMVAHS